MRLLQNMVHESCMDPEDFNNDPLYKYLRNDPRGEFENLRARHWQVRQPP